MSLALARAMELNDNQPELQKEEAMVIVPLNEKLAKKINIASGEDANFVVDQDEAWAWKEYENNLVMRNTNVF